jgi:hypothetical protein
MIYEFSPRTGQIWWCDLKRVNRILPHKITLTRYQSTGQYMMFSPFPLQIFTKIDETSFRLILKTLSYHISFEI